MKPSFDLETVYVQLLDGPEVARVEVSPEFWKEISNRPELHEGRLVVSENGKVVEHWGGPHCMNGIGLSTIVADSTRATTAA